jgi:hypothetical protein
MMRAMTRRADLVGALHDAHAHRVGDREEHDDAHDEGDENEDRAEKADHLLILRLQLGEIANLEIEAARREKCIQAVADARHVLAAMELQHDADYLLLTTAVQELLREGDVHGDEIVVELLDALRLCAVDIEAQHVRRAARRRRPLTPCGSARST